MRTSFIAFCFVLGFVPSASSTPKEPEPSAPASASSWSARSRLRPLCRRALALIEEASQRSAIIADQLEGIESSDLIVYVADMMAGKFTGPKSRMVILNGEGTARYLLIRLDLRRLSPTDQITALGHELHHALEVAAAPEVRDSASLAELYRQIGWETSQNRFETSGAQTAGFQIQKQLREHEKTVGSARTQNRASRIRTDAGAFSCARP